MEKFVLESNANNDYHLMQYNTLTCRSVDLNVSSDPFNGAGPGPYPSFMEPADDDRNRERDREQGDDSGDDGDNNDFSLIGEEDCQVQVRFQCVVLSCSVLLFLYPNHIAFLRLSERLFLVILLYLILSSTF